VELAGHYVRWQVFCTGSVEHSGFTTGVGQRSKVIVVNKSSIKRKDTTFFWRVLNNINNCCCYNGCKIQAKSVEIICKI
jgi:hypothetical protein